MYDVYLSYSSRDERAGGGLLALHKEKWARITINKFVCALSSLKYIGRYSTYRYLLTIYRYVIKKNSSEKRIVFLILASTVRYQYSKTITIYITGFG